MDVLLLLVCVYFQVIACNRYVLFSAEKKTYKEASQYCHYRNGALLAYGRDVVNAADQCNLVGEVWLALPFLQHEGCFQITLHNVPLSRAVPEASSFECASLCRRESYRYIGITSGTCACFTDVQDYTYVSSDLCRTRRCGNKTVEFCGIDNHFYVYKKVNEFYDKYQGQTLQRSSSGIVALHRRIQDISLHFFCLIQDSLSTEVKLNCSRQTQHNATTSTVTSIRTSTSAIDTPKFTSGRTVMAPDITKLINMSSKPPTNTNTRILNTTKSALGKTTKSNTLGTDNVTLIYVDSQPPKSTSTPVGLITGITAIVIVIVLVSAVIRYRQRMKKRDSERSPESMQMNTNYESEPDIENQNDGYNAEGPPNLAAVTDVIRTGHKKQL